MKTKGTKMKTGNWVAALAVLLAGAAVAGGDEWGDTDVGEWNAAGNEWGATLEVEDEWDGSVEAGSAWDTTTEYGSRWGAGASRGSAWGDEYDEWGATDAQSGEWDETVDRLRANTLKLRFRGALGERSGAGFFVDTNGWVLTCLGIAEGARQGYAETADGEKLPIKRVVGVSPKYNLLLLDLGGEREDALELADDKALRTGMAAHSVGMTRDWGWMDLAGVVTRMGQDETGMPLVEFSGWRGAASGGAPVAGADGKVIAVGTWRLERNVELNGQSQRYMSVPRERTGCLPAPLVRRFLESRHSGMALQELGAFHANAEVANWVMFICSEAVDAMVSLRNEVKAAEMEKNQILDINKVSFRQTLSSPIHWKNPEGLEEARKKLADLKMLAGRSMPLLAANDARARNSATYLKSALRAMNEEMALIEKSDGLLGDAFWQKYEQVKGKFLQINDFLFQAMQSAMAAYGLYGRYTSQPAYLTPSEARRTLRFLESRGGGF